MIFAAAAAAAKSLQSCPTLCDPIDGRPPGSPVPGILQTRTLEWVAISFSNTWQWKVKVKLLSCFRLFTTPWTAADQAPPSMGFSRQQCWSAVGCHCFLPSDIYYPLKGQIEKSFQHIGDTFLLSVDYIIIGVIGVYISNFKYLQRSVLCNVSYFYFSL